MNLVKTSLHIATVSLKGRFIGQDCRSLARIEIIPYSGEVSRLSLSIISISKRALERLVNLITQGM
ncbi:hypothetical protein [Planctopirus limnophila]|uniref:hypothetical protein n=1 Tax=Planctopirus limnophila TaxID=120 RepID=UPI0001A2FF75|nr:hypothetical protein [Planctopirus limnophila]